MRRIPLESLYNNDGMAYLTKQPDELVARVQRARLDRLAQHPYWKLRRRGSFDFPVAAVAAAVRLGAGGVVEEARVVLGAVASRPVLTVDASAAFKGKALNRRRHRAAPGGDEARRAARQHRPDAPVPQEDGARLRGARAATAGRPGPDQAEATTGARPAHQGLPRRARRCSSARPAEKAGLTASMLSQIESVCA